MLCACLLLSLKHIEALWTPVFSPMITFEICPDEWLIFIIMRLFGVLQTNSKSLRACKLVDLLDDIRIAKTGDGSVVRLPDTTIRGVLKGYDLVNLLLPVVVSAVFNIRLREAVELLIIKLI